MCIYWFLIFQIIPCTAKFDEELSEESIVVIKGKLTDDPLR